MSHVKVTSKSQSRRRESHRMRATAAPLNRRRLSPRGAAARGAIAERGGDGLLASWPPGLLLPDPSHRRGSPSADRLTFERMQSVYTAVPLGRWHAHGGPRTTPYVTGGRPGAMRIADGHAPLSSSARPYDALTQQRSERDGSSNDAATSGEWYAIRLVEVAVAPRALVHPVAWNLAMNGGSGGAVVRSPRF